MTDNLCVISAAIAGSILAQVSTTTMENITALGIVALVVYFFLVKFDRKMDTQDRKIDLLIEKMKQHGKRLRKLLKDNGDDDDDDDDFDYENDDTEVDVQ